MALVREEKFVRAMNLVDWVLECRCKIFVRENYEADDIVGGDMTY